MKKLLVLLLLLPFILSANAQESYYYLHDDVNPEFPGTKLMDTFKPSASTASYVDLDEGAVVWATLPFERETKLSGNIYATVFVEASFIKPDFVPDILPFQIRVIKATLVDIAPSGNMDTIASSGPATLLFLKNETLKTQRFRFENIEYVLSEGHSLGIKIEKVLDLLSYFPFSFLSPFFATNILYDSTYTKSYVSIPLNISGGLKLQCYINEKYVDPGENQTYDITIYNNAPEDDTVSISIIGDVKEGWNVTVVPEELTVEANSYGKVMVIVTAPEDAQEGDYLNITIFAQGKTGTGSIWLNTSITPPSYGVEVVVKTEEVEGELGENVTVSFIVKNLGNRNDTYNLLVECEWDYYLEEENITLQPGESKQINVTVKIPLNAAKNYTAVGLTARSSHAEDSNWATLHVIFTPAEKKEYGKIIGLVLFIVGVVVLFLIAYYLGRTVQKTVELSCEERMAEVAPGKSVEFYVDVINPLEKEGAGKSKIRYRFGIEGKLPENWRVDIDKEEVVLDGGEEERVKVTVHTPPAAPPEEWASIDFIATPDKGKSEKITLLVTLREPMPILKTEITHEPEEFEEGKKVITRVKIHNEGEKEAENKKVALLVNGKEKNSIEGITIPPNAYVEVEIPWIAEKENEIEVKLE